MYVRPWRGSPGRERLAHHASPPVEGAAEQDQASCPACVLLAWLRNTIVLPAPRVLLVPRSCVPSLQVVGLPLAHGESRPGRPRAQITMRNADKALVAGLT